MGDRAYKNPEEALCRQILFCGDLAAKLSEGVETDRAATFRSSPIDGSEIELPARAEAIAFSEGSEALPKPRALRDPNARARCLARFAHHELMAVELLAWALLRWSDAPEGLRRDWLAILRDEQEHCRLYLARLTAHGSQLADHALNPYFWRQAPRMAASARGACAFLAGVGLTLEQANLDFTRLYGDAFREAGDSASADVLDRVHADEIRHVASAARWLAVLAPERDETARYRNSVPFPLSAARAKGRRFEVEPRRAAGLEKDFIEYVRDARSTQERKPRGDEA